MADLRSCKILVTPRSFGQSDPNLHDVLKSSVKEVIYNSTGRSLSSAELVELLPDVDGFIAGVDVIDRACLLSANRLKVIARYGVGVDNVDLQAAKELEITVTNTPEANTSSVAELTIGLILSLLRQIPAAVTATREGNWPRMHGQTIEGKTVGVIGLGRIGKQVILRLKAFNCIIVAHDLFPDMGFVRQHNLHLASLEDVVKQADILTLHVPLSPKTTRFVDRNFISAMKAGSYLINTSRGELLDEDALLEGLESGHLSGAGLDVLSQEPPPLDHPLLKLSNVLVTPHAGAHTEGATNAMGWMAMQDCFAVLEGLPPKFRVI